MQLGHPGDTRQIFDTALRFVDADEPHRENLVKFIHTMQLDQLKRLREQSLQFPSVDLKKTGWACFSFRKKLLLFLGAVSAALVFTGLILALAGYYYGGN